MNSLTKRLGFIDDDFLEGRLYFPKNKILTSKTSSSYYYGKTEGVKTRFYWVNAEALDEKEIKIIHERIWNENKAELLFLEKENNLEIIYVNTSPKEDILEVANIKTNVEDDTLLENISKEHISTGAIWLRYSEALNKIKQQQNTVDKALEISLKYLRKKIG